MKDPFSDEIDLTEPLKKIYNFKKIILLSTLLASVIGVIIALVLPVKYSSSTIFIPQNQESNNSSLSGVASLVGVNLGGNSLGGEIPSSMYPQIAYSPKFKRLILDKIIDEKNNLNLKDYIINYYNIDNEILDNNSPLFVSEIEEKCFKILDDIISISVNQKDGFVTINCIMPVAEYSAILANESKEILQKIIIQNKIESANQNLKFSQEQLYEKKMEFNEIQRKLSSFKDSNLNLVNSFIINQQDKLEAEFQIINAVVTELSKQVETAKLQVRKDTPVFSTIKEALIPNKRISPKRTQLVIIFGIFGFIISSIFAILKDPLKKLFAEISES